MDGLLGLLGGGLQVALILFGFGLVVFVHELGHFVAARWAGVRVLAFAVGFGPAILSWRQGLGLRRGSWASDPALAEAYSTREVGTTEYRLNWLPLGGYVKMLGQDDADPSHRSGERDSFSAVPVWKRMIIISAGVVANLLTAAGLFVVVFSLGLKADAPVVGAVLEGSPAAVTAAENAGAAGVQEPGLQAGDVLVGINGRAPRSFDEARLSVITADAARPVTVEVRRPGVEGELRFQMQAERGAMGLLDLGFGPASSTRLFGLGGAAERKAMAEALARSGLVGVEPGATLLTVDGLAVSTVHEAEQLAENARGRSVLLGFENPGGARLEIPVATTPELPSVGVPVPGAEGQNLAAVEHLVGLTPVMTVGMADPRGQGYAKGLRTGDVFARLGAIEYPNAAEGITEVRARAGGVVAAEVIRDGQRLKLELSVNKQGQVGFNVGGVHLLEDPGAEVATLLARDPRPEASDRLLLRPGSRLTALNGRPVSSFAEAARVLQSLAETNGAGFAVELTLAGPPSGEPLSGEPLSGEPLSGEPAQETVSLTFNAEQAAGLRALGWRLPAVLTVMEPISTTLRSENVLGAVGLGLAETRRLLLTTYLTFARLAQGSIAPQVINGPVGIVHAGTSVLDRGVVWLLFFFAMVSVNLAVINFLPIPITDGGHMVFLLWEQATGRPVSVAVQNAATLAGLVLILGVFLFATYNDLTRLLGG
jgi:regulator of sigma E protease